MQTEDLEQKKLVYLYLMNYAKTQPELVILAVNTFVKDTDDPNPLVRALAIRTMGCLRAEKIIDYLCDPLQKCLRDENPYVRKTAALCVAKLYDLKPELVIDNGFLEQLQEMISDSNPMVEILFFHSRSWSIYYDSGGCKYGGGTDGYSHRCYIRTFHSLWNGRFYHHQLYLKQTLNCPQRMFRVGSRGHLKRLGPLHCPGWEGERAYLWTCRATVPTCKRERSTRSS